MILPSPFTTKLYIVSFNTYPSGAFISLYWYSPYSNDGIPISPFAFVVNCIGFPSLSNTAFPSLSYIPIIAPSTGIVVPVLYFFILVAPATDVTILL